MNDIEKLFNTPPDDFERYLFLAERELHLLEMQIAHTANVSHALDTAFDALLEDDDTDDAATTNQLVRRMRGFRVTDVNEQLTRIFGQLHAMHALYKRKAP